MPPDDDRAAEPRTPERRGADGPLAGPLSRIPLQSRFAVTIGVAVGLIASIALTGVSDRVSMAALWIGVGGGIVAAVVLWVRATRRS